MKQPHGTTKPLIWANVKPTPPGTVKLLLQCAKEIEIYLEAAKNK